MADAKQALDELLETLGETSQFVASGSLTPVLPGLEIKGVGSIGSPISEADAQRLIAKSSQAPYGRGEKTIVDTDVRRVWQIDPSKITFRNEEWAAHIASIVAAVGQEFGIQAKVNAQLYKLLVYEKDSFFAPHRDSEKTQGMFATLVVCLPSRHKGGTLIVSHDGQTKKIDTGGKNSEFQTQYAAFYADCQHEIKPITDGYRVCLVYNLAIAGRSKQPSAPRYAAAVEKAAGLLESLFSVANLSRIAIPFKHQYTEAGLDPSQLKGSDRARADVLVRAAESLGHQCYLALLTHHQSGEVDYSSYDFDYRSRRSYRRRYDYDDESFDGDKSAAEMGEVYEEDLTLDHWLDPQGRKQPFGEMHLEENEILDLEGKKNWSVRQEINEATGNEGVSMNRWYRQGVIVIWPRDRYFGILAREGQATAIPALEKMARGAKGSTIEHCRAFALEIISHWKSGRSYLDTVPNTARMLKLLERFGTRDLVLHFVKNVLPKNFDGSEGKSLARLFQRLGWEPFAAALREFLAQQKPDNYSARLDSILSICESLCCEPLTLTDERRAVCISFADDLAKVIERWDARPVSMWQRDREKRAGVVAAVVHAFAAISAMEHLNRFLEHVVTDTKHYDLHTDFVPDVKLIFGWIADVPAAQPAASRLLQHCLAALRAATAHPIEAPRDWTRDAELKCNCANCMALARFLRDPAQQVGRFPLRKELRQHLHQQIDAQKLDVTHVTDRKGSPQTLVCTKTQASYERRLKQYGVDCKRLAELEALAGGARSLAVATLKVQRKAKKGSSEPPA